MAAFTPTSDPAYVQDAQGRMVPTSSVDPADVAPAAGGLPTAPLANPPPTASAPGSGVDAIVSLLDHPAAKAIQPPAPRGLVQSGESVSAGLDKGTAGALVADNNTRTAGQADLIRGQAQDKMGRLTEQNQAEQAATQADMEAQKAEQRDHAKKREVAQAQELAIRDQSDPEVDPNQFMRDNGLAMVVLSALSGAIGGGLGGTEGARSATMQFMGMIDKRIDQNIQLQKEQIASGRVRRGNLIEFYQRQGLDEKESEQAARALYYAKAGQFAQLQKEAGSIADVGDAAEQTIAALKESNAKANQNLALATEDKHTRTYAPPVARAGADNSKAVKDALELDKVLEERGYSKERRAAVLKAAGLQAPEGPSAPERAAAKPSSEQEKRTAQLSSLTNLATQLDALPETTHSRETENILSRMGKGLADTVSPGSGDALMSKQEKANRQVFEQAVNNYASLQSQALGQGALAGPEFDRAKKAAYAMGPRELANAIRSFATTVGGKVPETIQAEDR